MSGLVGVDKIKWDKLETVNGRADRAPNALGWLASGNKKQSTDALLWLYEDVLHQSTPAPVAVSLVPFLLQLVELETTQAVRWQLLALLGDLACGGDHRPFVTGGDPASRAGKLHAAVVKGHGTILARLADKDAKTRSAAAFALAWLRKKAAPSLKSLRSVVAKEKDATARASALLAIAVLEGKQDFAAAAEAVTAMTKRDGLCWEKGNAQQLLARITHIAGAPVDIDVAIKSATGDAPLSELVAIVKQLFPSKIEPRKLTADQNRFLDALTSVPQRFGVIQLMRVWEDRGLPAKANDAREKLGLAQQQRTSPLDELITVGKATKRFSDHLADAVASPAKRKPLADVLVKTHTAEQVVDLCTRSLELWIRGQDKDGSLSRARVYADLFDAFGDKIVPVLRTYKIPGSMQGADGNSFMTGSIALPIFYVLAKRDKKPPVDRMFVLLNMIPLTVDFDQKANTPILVEAIKATEPKLRKQLVAALESKISVAVDAFKDSIRKQLA